MALFASFTLVLLAEMADKTQLLVMAFAAKYRAGQVMAGIAAAIVIMMGLAVAAGKLLTAVVPMNVIALAAAVSFIGFGLWTLRNGEEEEEGGGSAKWGPFVTVALAFFVAEMGDKTQLATVGLAVKYDSALAVFAGSTLGMLVADGAGLLVGMALHRHLPVNVLRWFAAIVFIVFGLAGLYLQLRGMTSPAATIAIVGGAAAFALALGVLFTRRTVDAKKEQGEAQQ